MQIVLERKNSNFLDRQNKCITRKAAEIFLDALCMYPQILEIQRKYQIIIIIIIIIVITIDIVVKIIIAIMISIYLDMFRIVRE